VRHGEGVGEHRAALGEIGNEWRLAAVDNLGEGVIFHDHHHDVIRHRHRRGG
jgi:hypothetical protein